MLLFNLEALNPPWRCCCAGAGYGSEALQQLVLIVADGRFHEKAALQRAVREVRCCRLVCCVSPERATCEWPSNPDHAAFPCLHAAARWLVCADREQQTHCSAADRVVARCHTPVSHCRPLGILSKVS